MVKLVFNFFLDPWHLVVYCEKLISQHLVDFCEKLIFLLFFLFHIFFLFVTFFPKQDFFIFVSLRQLAPARVNSHQLIVESYASPSNNLISLSYSMPVFSAILFGLFSKNYYRWV